MEKKIKFEIRKIGKYWYHRKRGNIGWCIPRITKKEVLKDIKEARSKDGKQ
jgi:hypothetical protein